MNASITQHRITSFAILCVALLVAYVSFTGEPVEAFLFPRIIATVMALLAIWNFVRAMMGASKVGEGVSWALARTIAPGVLVILLFIFVLAKWLGFYVASFVAFVAIFALYDPASHASFGAWFKRLVTAFLFMAVIYGLFNLLLQVQTPRGLFF